MTTPILAQTAGSTEDFLKSILESAMYGIMTFKAVRNETAEVVDFEWIFANDEAGGIIGTPSQDLLGRKMRDELPSAPNQELFKSFIQVVESGEPITREQYFPGTKPQWFKVSAVPLGDGLTVTFQDISDLKEALLDAEMRKKKYQKLFQESIDAIFLVGQDFRFLEVNASFREWFGYSPRELDGLQLSKLFVTPEEYQVVQDALQHTRIIEEYEFEMQDCDGRKRTGLINSVAMYDEDRQEDVYLGVLRDVTKRKQADRELLMAEKLSMSGKIARTIAHEVRNPLTNLTLALEQLRDEVPEELEDADLYFTIIQRNADRIGKLITDLLNSSKPKELQLHPRNLNEVVQEAVTLVRDRLKLQNMQLTEDYAENLPLIPIDRDQLNVALLNLCINALEAMKPGKGCLQVSTRLEEGRVVVRVSDNGVGIPKEDQERLFEPFFTAKKEGSGLGLTTVQNIIHSHRGAISVESELGEGTTFIIQFSPQS